MRAVTVLEDHPGRIPGQVPMHVTTAAGVDWTKTAESLPALGVDLEVLHIDDEVRNLDDLRRTEIAFPGEELERRRNAWQQMADLDAESVALRALLPQLAALAPGGDHAADPRLLEVQRIVVAETEFWRSVLGSDDARVPTKPAQEPPLPAGKALRVAPTRPAEPAAVATTLGEARVLLGARRWIVARTSFARVRSLCTEIATHAAATADKARDPVIAAKYRNLAVRCTDAARSIEQACRP